MAKNWIPDRGDIIWINHDPQRGREMRDRHPMLVLSPINFNQGTGIVIGLPMTTAEYNITNPFAVAFKNNNGTVSYVLTHQPKSFDWRERGASQHACKKAPPEVLVKACHMLNKIIELAA